MNVFKFLSSEPLRAKLKIQLRILNFAAPCDLSALKYLRNGFSYFPSHITLNMKSKNNMFNFRYMSKPDRK